MNARALIPKGENAVDPNFEAILLANPGNDWYDAIMGQSLWPQGGWNENLKPFLTFLCTEREM